MTMMIKEIQGVPSPLFEGPIRNYEAKLMDFLVQLGKSGGQNETLLKLVSCFLLHEKLTQEQLTELTGLSRGTISTNLRVLTDVKYIKKEMIPGSATSVYSFGGNLSEIASNTSLVKKELNNLAIKFFHEKLKLLRKKELAGKAGCLLLIERVEVIIRYLELRNKIVDIITKSKFIKDL